METSVLVAKLENLPESLKKEVEDFVDFLIFKEMAEASNYSVEDSELIHQYIKKLSKIETIIPKPVFGSGKGLFGKMADDFDAPLDEMKEYR
ncbi:MAG: type II toxin-antitoxin system VapB family antitoxin [Janthinobacterium lividum]